MSMDYTPNSHRSKEAAKETAVVEKKRANKVIKGNVTTKKKSELSKLSDVFISEDAANVKSYIFLDVLVPAIKKAVSDIVIDGVNMILFGSTNRSGHRTNASGITYTAYNKFSDRRDDRYVPSNRYNDSRSKYDFSRNVFEYRTDAEEVLVMMDEMLSEYKVVRVADFYDLIGVTGDFTDNDYGWTNLSSARVERVRDGYIIKMPRVMAIEK